MNPPSAVQPLAHRPDRQGKRTIAFHVDQELFRKFALVKAKYLATTEEMGIVALGLLFKHFVPEDEGKREIDDTTTASCTRCAQAE